MGRNCWVPSALSYDNCRAWGTAKRDFLIACVQFDSPALESAQYASEVMYDCRLRDDGSTD
jgi:hypothetical protein